MVKNLEEQTQLAIQHATWEFPYVGMKYTRTWECIGGFSSFADAEDWYDKQQRGTRVFKVQNGQVDIILAK